MIRTKDELKVKKETEKYFSEIDTVIFDIDGVLLDVRQSFRQAISQTVQFYFTEILGWKAQNLLLEPDETQLFKMAGGFNNDWELTYTAVLFFLVNAYLLKTTDTQQLETENLDLEGFTKKMGLIGGGYIKARKELIKTLDDADKDRLDNDFNSEKIKQIFQEIYAGVDYCRELYGFGPQYIREKGLLNTEINLVEPELLRRLPGKKGILTGRTKEETRVALRLLKMEDIFPQELCLYDDGKCQKPDPACLKIISEKVNTSVGLYIGDTTDDLRTVLNFNRDNNNLKFLSAQVCHGPEEINFYMENGADIAGLSTEAIISYLDERIING